MGSVTSQEVDALGACAGAGLVVDCPMPDGSTSTGLEITADAMQLKPISSRIFMSIFSFLARHPSNPTLLISGLLIS